MALGDVKAGYIGILSIGNTKIRCSSFSVNPNNDPLFYNHVIGLNDTVPSNYATKGEDVGVIQTQRRVWRPSTISITGGISFPATETGLQTFFNYAKYGNYFDIDFNYYCGIGKKFTNCRVNGFDFSNQAGDIAQVNVDIIASGITTTTDIVPYEDAEKIINLPSIILTGVPFSLNQTMIKAVSYKINNNAMPIYVSKDTTDLFPQDIRLGMQEVTGSILLYLKSGYEYIPTTLDTPSVMTISAGTWSVDLHIVFSSNKMDGEVGPIVTELPFVGVDKALSE